MTTCLLFPEVVSAYKQVAIGFVCREFDLKSGSLEIRADKKIIINWAFTEFDFRKVTVCLR